MTAPQLIDVDALRPAEDRESSRSHWVRPSRRKAPDSCARRERRKQARLMADAINGPPLVLIARWDGDVRTLWDQIETATDWGPFELESMREIPRGGTARARLFLCRFNYHGTPEARLEFEQVLFDVLSRIARWERPPAAA